MSYFYRTELLMELARWIAGQQRDAPLRVAIDGIDAAGKTTLADELAPYLQACGFPVVRASIDGFHRPRAERYRRGKLSPEGYYFDSFDLGAFVGALLRPLGTGGTRLVRTAVFDYRSDTPLDLAPTPVPPRAVLLCDGIFLLRKELRSYWDLSIFLHIAWETAVARALRRDGDYLGGEAAVHYRFKKRYIPGQQLYFHRCRPQQAADIVIDNNNPEKPAILGWRGRQRWAASAGGGPEK